MFSEETYDFSYEPGSRYRAQLPTLHERGSGKRCRSEGQIHRTTPKKGGGGAGAGTYNLNFLQVGVFPCLNCTLPLTCPVMDRTLPVQSTTLQYKPASLRESIIGKNLLLIGKSARFVLHSG